LIATLLFTIFDRQHPNEQQWMTLSIDWLTIFKIVKLVSFHLTTLVPTLTRVDLQHLQVVHHLDDRAARMKLSFLTKRTGSLRSRTSLLQDEEDGPITLLTNPPALLPTPFGLLSATEWW
jgi:hypothetical protein